ncbi:hypothetical protein, partial [Thermus sp.]|uniref:S8 family serine peptidase n=1 Tax=Thermus sp. TaxID=275 RepID=UPI0025FE026B
MRRWLWPLALALAACTQGPPPRDWPGPGLLLGYETEAQLDRALAQVGGRLEGKEPRIRVAWVRLPPGLTPEGVARRLAGLGLRFLEPPGERDY